MEAEVAGAGASQRHLRTVQPVPVTTHQDADALHAGSPQARDRSVRECVATKSQCTVLNRSTLAYVLYAQAVYEGATQQIQLQGIMKLLPYIVPDVPRLIALLRRRMVTGLLAPPITTFRMHRRTLTASGCPAPARSQRWQARLLTQFGPASSRRSQWSASQASTRL